MGEVIRFPILGERLRNTPLPKLELLQTPVRDLNHSVWGFSSKEEMERAWNIKPDGDAA